MHEKLTGQKAPETAGKVLDLWRPFIEDKAGADLDNLSTVIEDQQAFSRVIRHMLSAMEMAEDMGDDQEQSEEDQSTDEEQPRSGEQDQETSEDEAGQDSAPAEESEASQEQLDDGEMDGAEISEEEMSDEGDDDSETPGEMRRPATPFDDFNEKVDYKIFTQEFDEEITAEELCDEAELDRAVAAGADLIGVNQRDLVTFAVDTDRAVRMAPEFTWDLGTTLTDPVEVFAGVVILELKFTERMPTWRISDGSIAGAWPPRWVSAPGPRPHRQATGMPCTLPLGVMSLVLKSVWASSQITRKRRPRRRQCAATAAMEPMARLWSPPSRMGRWPSCSSAYTASNTRWFHSTTSGRCR